MRKIITGLSLVLMSYISQNLFSQCDYKNVYKERTVLHDDNKLEIGAYVGKNSLNPNSRNLFLTTDIYGNLEGKRFFNEIKTRIDEYAKNSYSKVDLGVKIVNKSKFSLGPEISFIIKCPDEESIRGLESKIGLGFRFKYDAGRIRGGNEVFFSNTNPLYLAKNSADIGFGELELFFIGEKINSNQCGIRFTTKRFRDTMGFFAEYSIRANPGKKYVNKFLNLGLTVQGKNK